MNEQIIYQNLMKLQTKQDVEEFIQKYGQSWIWKPIGGRENAGTIESGSEPADALAERITNGIDAILEKKYSELHPAAMPCSPRKAVEQWFNIPKGDLTNLSDSERRKLAEHLKVILLESADESIINSDEWRQLKNSPTVVIQDDGVGQLPDQFEKTFLSIGEKNKVRLPYLIGAYGQGGSIVYGFGVYTIIISRKPSNILEERETDMVGWTIIRCNERDPSMFTIPIYEYCTDANNKINRFDPKVLNGDFTEGSIVKMIQFELPQHSAIYTAPTGSLWWLGHNSLFDTVYPFSIYDRRLKRHPLKQSDAEGGRIVNGNRYRLNSGKKNNQYNSHSWEVELGKSGKVNIQYWVAEDRNKIQNFVKVTQPTVVILNGQRQISISKSELSLKGRDFIKDKLIIQVTADEMTPFGQRIFSSTRDRARKNQTYVDIIEQLKRNLIADEFLKQIDLELKEKTLEKETSQQEEKAKQLLAKLLAQHSKESEKIDTLLSKEADLPIAPMKREVNEEDASTNDIVAKRKIEPRVELQFIPSLLEVLNKDEIVEIEKGKGGTVRIFIDAEDNYFTREGEAGEIKFRMDTEDGAISKRSISDLRKGLINVRFEANEGIRVGTKRVLTIEITRHGMSSLIKSCTLKVIPPKLRRRIKKGSKDNNALRPPDIRFIDDTQEIYHSILNWSEKDVAEFRDDVVYVSKSNIYVNKIFKRIKGENSYNRYLQRYGAHIAFFTILQKQFEENLQNELPSNYRTFEMERAARSILQAIALNIEEVEGLYAE